MPSLAIADDNDDPSSLSHPRDDEEESNEGEEGNEVPVLSSIWDDVTVEKFFCNKSTKKWRCLWCNAVYASWNGTKALWHV